MKFYIKDSKAEEKMLPREFQQNMKEQEAATLDTKIIDLDKMDEGTQDEKDLANTIRSRIRIVSNVKFFAHVKNQTLKAIEKKAHVSEGYLSRIANGGYQSSISSEALISFAQQFKVPVDNLVYTDYTRYTEHELYLVNFLSKLIYETSQMKMLWKCYSAFTIVEEGLLTSNMELRSVIEPLFTSVWNEDHTMDAEYYNSLFFIGCDESASLEDDLFVAKFGDDELYLTKVLATSPPHVDLIGYELYIVSNNRRNIDKVCFAAEEVNTLFLSLLNKLYAEAMMSSRQPAVDDDVKEKIDNYMSKFTDEKVGGVWGN